MLTLPLFLITSKFISKVVRHAIRVEMSTGRSAMMLCGWEVKAGRLILFVDARMGGRFLRVIHTDTDPDP